MATTPPKKATIRKAQQEPMTDRLCKEPLIVLWEDVKRNLIALGERSDDPWLKRECAAGAEVVDRRIAGQESDQQTFTAVLAIYWKGTAALRESPDGYEPEFGRLAASLEALGRFVPDLDGKPSACQEAGPFDKSHSTYRVLFEICDISEDLETRASEMQKVFVDVEAHLPRGAGTQLKDSFANVVAAVAAAKEAAGEAQKTVAGCDPQAVRDAVEALGGSVSQVTATLSNVVCTLAGIKCLAQPAFFDILQMKVDEFALYAAKVVSAFHKLSFRETGIGKQLKAIWQAMRSQVTVQLKQAFERWQERNVCPPSMCYDTATPILRKVIEDGLADAEQLTPELSCWDEPRLRRQRTLVVAAIDEIERLYCNAQRMKDFNSSALTSLGSKAMRLQAVLGRGTTDLADAFRTTVESWKETFTWLQQDTDSVPSPRVEHHLRTIAGVYGWLENSLRSSTAGNQTVPSAGLGWLEFCIADENGNPCANSRVHITTPTGDQLVLTTDAEGRVRHSAPKGCYKVSADTEELFVHPIMMYVQ
jgi:hypothetical protein